MFVFVRKIVIQVLLPSVGIVASAQFQHLQCSSEKRSEESQVMNAPCPTALAIYIELDFDL